MFYSAGAQDDGRVRSELTKDNHFMALAKELISKPGVTLVVWVYFSLEKSQDEKVY